MGCIHKEYYSADARYLSDKAIQEIKETMSMVPDAINAIAKKYHINYYHVLDYILNHKQTKSRVKNLFTTFLNTEIKKRSFKSQSKSIHISDSVSSSNLILVDTDDSIKKITSKDLDALYEKEARRDEKNITNMTHLLAIS
ncbi:4475_t:CDS:2 [Cetraspora pellucida]|uniref:4475_t:CDS:1 n=1 Tax=Cetraspora pellucida TaxID=1433469 RepID=A0ACA9M1L8_9GLOM|nr:4475_t:CDS:2 [Cetraspora pellucida]